MKNQIAFRCLLAFLFALIFAGHVSAQLFWAGAGLDPATSGSGTWDNANLQWSSTFPSYTAATWNNNIANFDGTGGGTVTIGANITVNDINFGANAGAFTLDNSGLDQSINILGAGITNNSANTQTIINSGLSSFTSFRNSATAANATIINSGSGSFMYEMGISPEVFSDMLKVPSQQIRFVGQAYALEYKLMGEDPAWEEWERARKFQTEGEAAVKAWDRLNQCTRDGIDNETCFKRYNRELREIESRHRK